MNKEKTSKSEIFSILLFRFFFSWVFSKILAYFGIYTIWKLPSLYFIFLFWIFVFPTLASILASIFRYIKARKRKEYLTDYEKYNLQDADFEELYKLLDELEKDVKERKKNEYRKNK